MILCCGEALIDMLPRQSIDDDCTVFAPFSGGAVFNTAIALGRLGISTGFWCGLSDDLFGQQLQRDLTASGVSYDRSPISHRPTTLAFVALVDGNAQYAFYDENTAAREVKFEEMPELDEEVDALFFGGISLVAEPCGSVLERLMHESGERVTMLDPNIRPGFVADEEQYRARIDRMIKAASIIKLSDEDLHWLYGEGDLEQHARNILSSEPDLVVVTQGASGAIAWSKSSRASVTPPVIKVVDTVGAGDTFNAGLLAALDELQALKKGRLESLTGEELSAALKMACSVAAVTVSREGANPPCKEELGGFEPNVLHISDLSRW